MNYFDTHCHLQDLRLNHIRDDFILRAEHAGVKKMLCCGTREDDWEGVLNLSDKYPSVVPALGIHPWFVHTLRPGWIQRMDLMLRETKCAVGEIGLDYLTGKKDQKVQEQVFIDQLRLAKKYNRPLSVHCRKAWQRIIDILKKEAPFECGVVIHSFSGSAEVLQILEKLGCYISFSGSVTKKNNKKANKAVTLVSLDRLLLETDSPDIQPEGYENALNEPANIDVILVHIANIRGVSKNILGEKIFTNSVNLFR